MAQQAGHPSDPPPKPGFFRKIFGHHNAGTQAAPQPAAAAAAPKDCEEECNEVKPDQASTRPGNSRQGSYKVVPGLPRAQTFKRQQSEQRTHLEPVAQTPDERRALSVDRRSQGRTYSPIARALYNDPRVSAPGNLGAAHDEDPSHLQYDQFGSTSPPESEYRPDTLEHMLDDQCPPFHDTDRQYAPSMTDAHSVADSVIDEEITRELDTIWILNLSMHFRDRSKREKFFVTYRQDPHAWRRVTISLDYRNAPPGSLEATLARTRYQREKIAKIYEAIRESLQDIQFYDTVTNLKLQTSDGRLFVHVVEDGNEIIHFPRIEEVRHLRCRQVRERDTLFDSHMSGFVYKVTVADKPLIMKEIPSPETVDEFLYEINALNALRDSENVIDFYGVVVDDAQKYVKGLLIDYADRGTLIDLLYDAREHGKALPWATREKWARQIVQGLADVHESGFVQGDFTLSNIVINKDDDARIIDINRRGCPVGWEPPEAAALLDAGHRIAMYIGVKSDLYQLGMVLWAIAVLEDEPETRGRPLVLGPEERVPDWYRQLTEICLSPDPRTRLPAIMLLQTFPALRSPSNLVAQKSTSRATSSSEPYERARSPSEERTSGLAVRPSSDWSYVSRSYVETGTTSHGRSYYPPRGRSPPSHRPSTSRGYNSSRELYDEDAWNEHGYIPRSHSFGDGIVLDHDQIPATVPNGGSLDVERLVGALDAVALPDGTPRASSTTLQDSEHTALPAEEAPTVPRVVLEDVPPDDQLAMRDETTPSVAPAVAANARDGSSVEDEVTGSPEKSSSIQERQEISEPAAANAADILQEPPPHSESQEAVLHASEGQQGPDAYEQTVPTDDELHKGAQTEDSGAAPSSHGYMPPPDIVLNDAELAAPSQMALSNRTEDSELMPPTQTQVATDPLAPTASTAQLEPGPDEQGNQSTDQPDGTYDFAPPHTTSNSVSDCLTGIGDCHSYMDTAEVMHEKAVLDDDDFAFPGRTETLPQMISTDAKS